MTELGTLARFETDKPQQGPRLVPFKSTTHNGMVFTPYRERVHVPKHPHNSYAHLLNEQLIVRKPS